MLKYGLCLLSLVMLGCGGSDATKGRAPTLPASGQVKMFGAPLANASVAFAPKDGQPTAVGTTDDEGNFKLTTYEFGDGAAVGAYKVVISKAVAAPTGESSGENHGDNYVDSGASSHGGGGVKGSETLVPAQYSSSSDTPLSAEVTSSGENSFTFEIK